MLRVNPLPGGLSSRELDQSLHGRTCGVPREEDSHAAPRLPILLVLLILPAGAAQSAVQVITGPTPIPGGDAKANGDITVVNDKLAFALAVESPVPYGVPRGAIVDIAPVTDGKIAEDHCVFADFIPNNWSAWPNTYHHIKILEHTPTRAVIQSVRDWGKATITTTYTLTSNSDHIELQTTMHNGGNKELPNLLSGLTLWPHGGYLFPVPGLAPTLTDSAAAAALSDRVTAYDEDWTLTLHAPYFDHVGDGGSRDLLLQHTMPPGATRTFNAWLQVGPRGDLAPVVRAEIQRKHLESGSVLGTVTDHKGQPVDEPVVVVEKDHKPYAWTLGSHDGHYELPLPTGDYTVYATGRDRSQPGGAEGHPGGPMGQTDPTPLRIAPHTRTLRDFHNLEPAGHVQLRVSDSDGAPLDARIAIQEGRRPLVEFLGRQTFFTALEPKGHADLTLAPGNYVVTVSSGGGFFSAPKEVPLTIKAGATQPVSVVLPQLFTPRSKGWFAADLHHHADQAEAVTPAPDLARSQLAAGLDLLFVSDHDSTVNLAPLQAIARQRDIPFIPSIELSPSWGHFNAYPINLGQTLGIDTSTATVAEIFKEARRLGATTIQVNHPYIPYGYFASIDAHVAPGGFDPGFDLVEINVTAPNDDDKVLHRLWEAWNSGQHYYLAAGTDTHDVWSSESGRIRTFAHVDGKLTPESFTRALREGHGYVSRGPLIYPSVLFGNTVKAAPGKPFNLSFELESVAGLERAELVGAGTVIETRVLTGKPTRTRIKFSLAPAGRARWYQLLVADSHGAKAYTDPIWVDSVRTTSKGDVPIQQ